MMITSMLLATLPQAQAQLMPLIILALLIDGCFIAVWYFLGSALNNQRAKGVALGEFYQLIGTVLIIGIVLGSLAMLSTSFYSVLNSNPNGLMSQSSLTAMCSRIESTSQLDILGPKNSLLSGVSSSSRSFPGFCSLVALGPGASMTQQLEYPLSAASIVTANLTNQTAGNLNATFTMDSWFGFQSKLAPNVNICADIELPELCDVPIAIGSTAAGSIGSPDFDMKLSITPYSGYSLILSNMQILGSLLSLSMQSFIAQMLLISIVLYAWPWLLFGGILLRTTAFTRKLGGLLIAVAIAAILIYPAMFAIQYLSLGNGLPVGAGGSWGGPSSPSTGYLNASGLNSTYGYSPITTLPGSGVTEAGVNAPSGNYIINFFVEPNIKSISLYYSCWPNNGGKPDTLGWAEAGDIANLLIPGASLISLIKYSINIGLGSSSPTFPLAYYCNPDNAVKTFFAMLNAYGIIGMTSLLIPLINVIVTITSIAGLSDLLGGDTSLAGLAKIL